MNNRSLLEQTILIAEITRYINLEWQGGSHRCYFVTTTSRLVDKKRCRVASWSRKEGVKTDITLRFLTAIYRRS